MTTRFVPVADVRQLDELIPRPGAVLLFLHDPGCVISLMAYREMARLGGDVPLVDVRRARDVSHEIARRTGVRHESPQVIVLRDGRAVWFASHGAITTEAVRAAAGSATAPVGVAPVLAGPSARDDAPARRRRRWQRRQI